MRAQTKKKIVDLVCRLLKYSPAVSKPDRKNFDARTSAFTARGCYLNHDGTINEYTMTNACIGLFKLLLKDGDLEIRSNKHSTEVRIYYIRNWRSHSDMEYGVNPQACPLVEVSQELFDKFLDGHFITTGVSEAYSLDGINWVRLQVETPQVIS